jgi:hypothetical protein
LSSSVPTINPASAPSCHSRAVSAPSR